MASEFSPLHEAEADEKGRIQFSEGELKDIPAPPSTGEEISISKSDILDFGNEGFLLHNVLSSSECQHFINEGEKAGFEKIRGARDNYRSNLSTGNCLTAENTKTAEVQSVPVGKVYSPDEMCRLQIGAGSHVCRSFYGYGGGDYNTICRSVWCAKVDGSSQCAPLGGADGFTCGKDKECSLGSCKASSTPHSVSDTCPLGDTPSYGKVGSSGKSCDQLVTSSFAGDCYYGYQRRMCCSRCETLETSTAGCEWGDKASGCATLTYPYTCYKNEKLCCGSCAKHRNPALPTGCEYGDKVLGCQAPTHCSDQRCCATCASSSGK